MGYRWFARTGQTPLFPFGFGLSYTTFTRADLQATAEQEGVQVSFTLTNSGARGRCRGGADLYQPDRWTFCTAAGGISAGGTATRRMSSGSADAGATGDRLLG